MGSVVRSAHNPALVEVVKYLILNVLKFQKYM